MLNNESALLKDKRTGLSDMQHRHYTTVATIICALDKPRSARKWPIISPPFCPAQIPISTAPDSCAPAGWMPNRSLACLV